MDKVRGIPQACQPGPVRRGRSGTRRASGQHLLLTVGIQGGFVTGRIGDGKIRLLPLPRQPYSGYPIVAW